MTSGCCLLTFSFFGEGSRMCISLLFFSKFIKLWKFPFPPLLPTPSHSPPSSLSIPKSSQGFLPCGKFKFLPRPSRSRKVSIQTDWIPKIQYMQRKQVPVSLSMWMPLLTTVLWKPPLWQPDTVFPAIDLSHSEPSSVPAGPVWLFYVL